MPDVHEHSRGLVLMVWGDSGHWLVADEELAAGLLRMDGARSLQSAFGRELSREEQAHVTGALAGLESAGVLGKPNRRPDSTTLIHSIALNLTRRCNLQCRFCFVGHDNDASKELSASQIVDFLRQARSVCVPDPSLTILGGEPLLESEKLLDVVAGARGLSFACLISTNGTCITDTFARRAAQLGLQVQVSLDGPDAATHDSIRGPGSFEKTIAGIRALTRRHVHTILSTVVWKEGLIGPLFRLAHSLGTKEARFIPLKTMGVAMGMRSIALTRILSEGLAVYRDEPQLRGLFGRDALSIMADTCQYPSRRASCGSGSNTVLLDADGGLYPCLNTCSRKFLLGRISDPAFNFPRMWREDAILKPYRSAIDVESEGHECRACPVRRWCLGGCRGETDACTGSLRARSPHCEDLRRAILDVMWMLADIPQLAKKHRVVC